MIRLPVFVVVSLFALSAACYDRPNAAPSSDGQPTSDGSPGSTRGGSGSESTKAAGVTAVTADAAAGPHRGAARRHCEEQGHDDDVGDEHRNVGAARVE